MVRGPFRRRPAPLERRLGIVFKERQLLGHALTHRSYAYERGGLPTNERMEFLGDAVLGIIVTDAIYHEFPDHPEGELAKLRASLVNMTVLADVAREVGLGEAILLGRGEEMTGGREKGSILADTLEAVFGAVYIDRGMRAARKLILRLFMARILGQIEGGTVQDYKTSLQEVAAGRFGTLPEYQLTETGPDHAKRFSAQVALGGEALGRGEGRSKKEAEQAAARAALERLAQAGEIPALGKRRG
jgi:ribonuclease-3